MEAKQKRERKKQKRNGVVLVKERDLVFPFRVQFFYFIIPTLLFLYICFKKIVKRRQIEKNEKTPKDIRSVKAKKVTTRGVIESSRTDTVASSSSSSIRNSVFDIRLELDRILFS